MTSIQQQIEIEWPVEALFNYVSDLSNNHAWQRQVVDATWIGENRHEVGSAFLQTRSILGKQVPALMQMTSYQRFQKRSWIILHDRLRQELALEFEPRGEKTLLKLTIDFDLKGSVRSLKPAVLKHAMREGYENLSRLKNILENS
ncbi:SRPBCC family protein [Pseudochryseolinea flava]|uniref:SRPBCC family protein n=1 Tax=Pseudochryseolinea flava TaxID=2059302 RepID=A0A364Y4R1_9BACT|nr:SRPBCC family protein [Pseudochryseolinea flava]RAW01739.1 hypothetical protein DQQ10_08810 [Pseudochryseolinea flava]